MAADLDRARTALVTIDVQRDFAEPTGSAYVDGTWEVLPRIAELVEAFRGAGLPVYHVVRLYHRDGSNAERSRVAAVRRGIVEPGSAGSELAQALTEGGYPVLDASLLLGGGVQQVGAAEHVVYKPRWGMFFATPLAEHLHARGLDQLVVAGANFPNCPRTSIYEASERDLELAFVTDALSRIYDRGVDELRAIGAQDVVTADVVAWAASTTVSA